MTISRTGLTFDSELTYFNLVRLRVTGMPLLAVLFAQSGTTQKAFATDTLPMLVSNDWILLSGEMTAEHRLTFKIQESTDVAIIWVP